MLEMPLAGRFPDGIPDVPTHGCATVPVDILLAWHRECYDSETDLAGLVADLASLVAARDVAVRRVAEGEARRNVAKSTYLNLIREVYLANLPGGSESLRSWAADKGKGKARTSEPSTSVEDEVHEDLDPGAGDGDSEGPAGTMDVCEA